MKPRLAPANNPNQAANSGIKSIQFIHEVELLKMSFSLLSVKNSKVKRYHHDGHFAKLNVTTLLKSC